MTTLDFPRALHATEYLRTLSEIVHRQGVRKSFERKAPHEDSDLHLVTALHLHKLLVFQFQPKLSRPVS
ncbi:hypothetical protein H310_14072 [Aphanomyces invadans]|uniref:Uncharacterized protein n=1 Tax=Aphanomyces invadans TaxID=157072 RepID=A0A024TBB0_9STRA|nr:hypothetical protein H310_14072 [Aphanomyces invadans]ETV91405.1 hypothetical protein H310_14072 [Aphanomyces invadans]|eukprot:XP_008880033.1 hypothetical protein H310_14072 [Aphanomyces invadans]